MESLASLNLLDLSGNLFSSVPRNLPPTIQQLYLSNNSLSGLDEDSFVGFLNLKYLRLSHCGLKSVPTTLQYLYLEANEIR
ncbi:lumican, partial [Lates japonicus]